MASKRGYLTQEELEEFADITISDATEADEQISQAEEMIDEFVGPQDKFISYELSGLIAAGGSNNVTLESTHQNNMQKNYLRGCWIEIIGGTGEGQRKKITAQTLAGVITTETNFTTALDTTSYYRIYQLGKFPRTYDVQLDGVHTPAQYYKSIPEKVRQAVAAQVAYKINMGEDFFNSGTPDLESESIGDYSYSKGDRASSVSGSARLVAPRAKLLLRGIINRIGRIV